MKKQISVRELKEYYEKHLPGHVTYYSENQNERQSDRFCKLRLHFPAMLIFENPNQICLKSGSSSVCFNDVRFAEIDTESTVLGTVVTLYCGRSRRTRDDAAYTLVMF